jgi:putative permease
MRSKNPIFQTISQWFERTFADPEVISLFMILVISLLLLEFFGTILIPILVSIIIAYLLNTPVRWLTRTGCPRLISVWMIYILFLGCFIYGVFYLIPLIGRQFINLMDQLPSTFVTVQLWFTQFMQKHSWIVSQTDMQHILVFLREQTPKLGQTLIRISWAAIPNMAEIILYLVLVPLLVFFFLKDSRIILTWLKRFLPRRHLLVKRVSQEVYGKIGSYVKGRVIEVFMVGITSTIAFSLFGLQNAIFLGVLVGLSVIVPYIGAIVVTIPIVILALVQWGLSAHFWSLMIFFAAMIAFDGNILFPLLFAQTMDLHPVVIILAVLVFGGIWGFWGVFFAIPLATLVDAVLRVWPRPE